MKRLRVKNIPILLNPKATPGGKLILSPMQEDYVVETVKHRFIKFSAPSGSGKSTAMIAFGAVSLARTSNKELQLIAVPQKHIGPGFMGPNGGAIKLQIGGVDYEWRVSRDLTALDAPDSGKKIALIAALTADRMKRVDTTNRVFLCCHATLCGAWMAMSTKQRSLALKNIHIMIDEGHHVNGVYSDEELDLMTPEEVEAAEALRGRLGTVVSEIVNGLRTTSRLTLASATMFRGDRTVLLSPEVESRFYKFQHSLSDFLPTTGITSVESQYIEYDGTDDMVAKLTAIIASEPDEYHPINFPSKTRAWRTDDGDEIASKIFAEVNKVWPTDPVTYNAAEGSGKVLDLVHTDGRDHRKKLLLQEPKTSSGGTPQFNAVLAVNLNKEGTDWPCASRLHSLSIDKSPVQHLQAGGRLTRRFDGKTDIIHRTYIPKFEDNDDEGVREMIESRVRQTLALSVWEEQLCPIVLPAPITRINGGTREEVLTLTDFFLESMGEVSEFLLVEWEMSTSKTEKDADSIIDDIFDRFNVFARTTAEGRRSLRKGLKGLVLTHVRHTEVDNVVVDFGLGLDLSILDTVGFPTLVQGRSAVFSAKWDATMLRKMKDALLKQFPVWVEEFKVSRYLSAYPKRASRSHARSSQALFYRFTFRKFLAGEKTWWSAEHTKIIKAYPKVWMFFNDTPRSSHSRTGEASQLEHLVDIEDFVKQNGRMPKSCEDTKCEEHQMYRRIGNWNAVRRGKGDGNIWYPSLADYAKKSEHLDDYTFVLKDER